ncbi:DNA polymerase IV [Phytohabitans houttuyneae]|uniref:DNA polymerase IV n=1 Tax=Phytohabitans houttuyneae TaxID=1076126 RepID=A0A6V8K1X0_9ACTN|nr:DNA polymerase IV [Phytohabitans houttuyneae]GFJ77580.1 DNA polymerase IV [Phytohabitans houttuyneae]
MGRSQAVPRGDSRFGPEGDDSGSPILHVDMDAFYASVEVHRDPSLKGRPVVVGGVGPRGVVSSASYEAREFGVRSAMPTARARALCPAAVFIPPDFTAYTAASRAVMGIFRDVTPLVEPLSLDEAFLDVAGARRLLGPPAAIARLIRSRVQDELGLTCSVGVAPTKFVAKLGSTRAKPDGLLVVPADQVLEFLHPLPVAALWGVGEKAAETLGRLGLRTVGDVARAPVGMLRSGLGEAASTHLHELSWGRDPRRVTPELVDKSIGAEVTFDTDVADPAVIRRALLSLSEKTGARLRRSGQVGRTVSIKVRMADFRTVSRSRTLPGPTDVAREIFDTAWALWEALGVGGAAGTRRAGADQQGLGGRIRLVGVRVEGLTQAGATPHQPALGEPEHGWRDAEAAVDAAAAKFGRAVVRPASLLRRADDG